MKYQSDTFFTAGDVMTILIFISGIVLGIHWFGWWFIVPAILLKTKVT
ncbi:MAG: hypothetical protein RLY61_744 [Candidatus Parcubacteria bacterium]|jgi:hypothetical protein